MELFYTLLIGALVIGLVFTLRVIRVTSPLKGKPAFIIAGPCNAGKTCLFKLLSTGKLPKATVMSQELNTCESFRLPADREKKLRLGDFKLVEYPGHLKLQNLYLYQHLKDKSYLKSCKGLIYLIDSSAFNADYCHSVADQMFSILQYTESVPGGVDILVACNKSEVFTAKPVFKIKEMLLQEINRIKVLKLKSLNQVDFSQDDESIFSENDDFKFDQLEGNFDFVAGSVTGGKVENWENWINERGVN